MSDIEDSAIVLVSVSAPHRPSLVEEVLLYLHVPVFVLTVELEVLTVRHVIDSKDTVIAVHGKVLDRCDRGRNHLLKVVHLVHMLVLVPEPIRSVHEDEVLILIIGHLANVVKVDVLHECEHREHVEGVAGTSNRTLDTILHVHVLVVVTVTDTLKAPTGTILELLRDLPEIPVVGHPAE